MAVVFWILFLMGWALHLLSQAQASVQSSSNGLDNAGQWLRLNAHIVIVRLFLAVMSMLLWHEAPELFGELIGRAVPMTKATCGIVGFSVDAAWDKITFLLGLKVEIPHLSPPKSADTPTQL